jgi:hypothetical protein
MPTIRFFASFTIALIACLLSTTLNAQTARLAKASGTVTVNGVRLQEGQRLDFGSTVQTGADGIAAVRIEWPVDRDTCYVESMFGFGRSFPVKPPEATTRCDRHKGYSSPDVFTKAGLASGKGDGRGDDDPEAAEFLSLKEALFRGMGMLRQNENRTGTDLDKGQRVSSAEACALRCANDNRCQAMTFIKSAQLCYLKQDAGNATYTTDMDSALKRINPRTIVARPQ